MWYVAKMLFAQKPVRGKRRVLCETCRVLLCAATARKAYQKAQVWATGHIQGSDFRLVGIQHINDILEEKIGDGTEIGGSFFYKMDPWGHKNKLIPNPDDIPIISLEANPKMAVGEIASKQHSTGMLKDLFPEKRIAKHRSR
jgi:hypothetical protein